MPNLCHRFIEIEQLSPRLIGNLALEMEEKLKLELESLFEKSIFATFFRFIRN